MSKQDELYSAIRSLIVQVQQQSGVKAITAKVKSVDNNERTCEVSPQDGGPPVRARLQSTTQSDKGLLLVPEQGSTVVIDFLDETEAVVVLTTEINKVLLDTEKFEMNGGDNGGLINIQDLVNDVNSVKQDINTLKQVFAGWTTSGGDGGAALKGAAATWYGQQLSTTKVQDYEDDKITH